VGGDSCVVAEVARVVGEERGCARRIGVSAEGGLKRDRARGVVGVE
jgi:hypothetical protein